MNKLCRKVAKREGFTLVELIVVIAILGILAGIAIPVYSGYIAKANEAADMQLLDSVNTAAAFAVMDKEVSGQLTKIVVTPGPTPTIEISYKYTDSTGAEKTGTLGYEDVKQYIEGNDLSKFKSGANKIATLDFSVDQPRWKITDAPSSGG